MMTPSVETRDLRGPRRNRTLLILFLLCVGGQPGHAQTVVGRILDEQRGGPVSGALVRLLDRGGRERLTTVSDSAGRFVLTPAQGEFYLDASRLGYVRVVSPLLAMPVGAEAVPLDLVMVPAPLGLDGISVVVDPLTRAAEDLRALGVDPEDLGSGWSSQADIDAIEVKRDVGNILEWHRINGMRVVRPENVRETRTGAGGRRADFGMCVSLTRGRTWQGVNRCALPVIDGIPATNENLLYLDPTTIAAIAILQPTEARVAYGSRADAGAVLIWTKTGR